MLNLRASHAPSATELSLGPELFCVRVLVCVPVYECACTREDMCGGQASISANVPLSHSSAYVLRQGFPMTLKLRDSARLLASKPETSPHFHLSDAGHTDFLRECWDPLLTKPSSLSHVSCF